MTKRWYGWSIVLEKLCALLFCILYQGWYRSSAFYLYNLYWGMYERTYTEIFTQMASPPYVVSPMLQTGVTGEYSVGPAHTSMTRITTVLCGAVCWDTWHSLSVCLTGPRKMSVEMFLKQFFFSFLNSIILSSFSLISGCDLFIFLFIWLLEAKKLHKKLDN